MCLLGTLIATNLFFDIQNIAHKRLILLNQTHLYSLTTTHFTHNYAICQYFRYDAILCHHLGLLLEKEQKRLQIKIFLYICNRKIALREARPT